MSSSPDSVLDWANFPSLFPHRVMAQISNVNTPEGISWHVTQLSASSQKPHLVLIPSGEGDSTSFTRPADDCTATYLAQYFTITTFDMPGFSRTSCSSSCLEDLTAHKIASQIIGLLDKLNISKASFYGCSSGGLVAMALLEGWESRVERVVVHEMPLSCPMHLAKLKENGDSKVLIKTCRDIMRGMSADDLLAWERLGSEYHRRLEKNYITWIKTYVGRLEAERTGWRSEKGDDFNWEKVSWTVGRKSPMGWFMDNVVFAAKRGIEIETLNAMHFPQVSNPRGLAEHIQKCCEETKG